MADLFCFSGNGMSRQVAEGLRRFGVGIEDDGTLGFVFPVYGWRPPRILARFLRDGLLARLAGRRPDYVWAVMTCGFDVGYADQIMDRLLRSTLGRELDAAFSVRMPDTYVCLPGFRLNPQSLVEEKLRLAQTRIREVAARIKNRDRLRDLKRGVCARMKTHVLGKLFDRFLVNDRFFRVDSGRCVKCGECVANCPAGAIGRTSEGGVEWRHDGSCTGCLRCLHNCPVEAIEYGWFTKGKRRLKSGEKGMPW